MSERAPVRRGPLVMSARRRWTLYVTSFALWLSGALWIYFHYFGRKQGPFGFINSPWEHNLMVIHGAFSFAIVWYFGLLWNTHVTTGWWMHWRRRSGGTLAGVTMFLTLTGYGLYYIAGEKFRNWTSIAHWAVGLAALAIFIIHRISKTAPRKKRAPRKSSSSTTPASAAAAPPSD